MEMAIFIVFSVVMVLLGVGMVWFMMSGKKKKKEENKD